MRIDMRGVIFGEKRKILRIATWIFKLDVYIATGRGFDPGSGGRFSDGGEVRKHPCVQISAHVEDPREIEINP